MIINGEKVTITERKEAAGLANQRDFGGTKKWRTCYVSDCTGHAMLNVVSDRLIAEKVPVIERVEALRLIHDGKRCYGAIVRDLITGELMAYVAKATAIATGGAGRIYRVTTWRSPPALPRFRTWKPFSSTRRAFSRPAFW